jgi:hypothetical protein
MDKLDLLCHSAAPFLGGELLGVSPEMGLFVEMEGDLVSPGFEVGKDWVPLLGSDRGKGRLDLNYEHPTVPFDHFGEAIEITHVLLEQLEVPVIPAPHRGTGEPLSGNAQGFYVDPNGEKKHRLGCECP